MILDRNSYGVIPAGSALLSMPFWYILHGKLILDWNNIGWKYYFNVPFCVRPWPTWPQNAGKKAFWAKKKNYFSPSLDLTFVVSRPLKRVNRRIAYWDRNRTELSHRSQKIYTSNFVQLHDRNLVCWVWHQHCVCP